MRVEDFETPSGGEFGKLEQALVRAGARLPYPPTPRLVAQVERELAGGASPSGRMWSFPERRMRRFAFAFIATLLLALTLLLAFPAAREALAGLLGLRSIRIFSVTPTPVPTNTLTPLPTGTSTPTPTGTVTPPPPGTNTPLPTATPGPLVQCCETTLSDARAHFSLRIYLPPGEAPSRVYLQTLPELVDAQQLILVFGNPAAPRYTLYESQNWVYGKGIVIFGKEVSQGTVLQETTVNGVQALWLTGAPHILVTLNAQGTPVAGTERPVDANTLAWENDTLTFRLETRASQADAVRFAESLRPSP